MIKRIIVVLDGSEVGKVTRTYAINFAKEHQAELLGIAVLDTPWLTAPQPEPLGGSAFKVRRDEEVIRFTQDRIKELLQEFNTDCATAGISARSFESEGFPANEIEVASYQADMIILGKTTDFHFDSEGDSDITVKHIAHDNPRPLIIVPRMPEITNQILIAYDGEIRSARALHMFLLLNLGQGKRLHLININKDKSEGQDILSYALKLCEVHGIETVSKVVHGDRSKGESLIEIAHEIKAEMIVMGAFGHTLIRETFFGSCSKTVLKHSAFPLFIHH